MLNTTPATTAATPAIWVTSPMKTVFALAILPPLISSAHWPWNISCFHARDFFDSRRAYFAEFHLAQTIQLRLRDFLVAGLNQSYARGHQVHSLGNRVHVGRPILHRFIVGRARKMHTLRDCFGVH